MKKVLKVLLCIAVLLVLVIAAALGVFTLTEYRPADTETVVADHAAKA